MRYVSNWRRIARKAWSFKLILLAATLSAVEALLPVLERYIEPLHLIPPTTFATLSFLTSSAAALARLLVQPDKMDTQS